LRSQDSGIKRISTSSVAWTYFYINPTTFCTPTHQSNCRSANTSPGREHHEAPPDSVDDHDVESVMPIEDWGKLLGHVPSATAILDRFLQIAEVNEITGRRHGLKDRAGKRPE
jgi:hypothetical protein